MLALPGLGGEATEQRLLSLSAHPLFLPLPAASWQELGEPWVPARAGPRWWFRAEHKEALGGVGVGGGATSQQVCACELSGPVKGGPWGWDPRDPKGVSF
jgi:hypothetical protein